MHEPEARPLDERFANAPFPLYGLPPEWKGARFLGGFAWEWHDPGPEETTALSLEHGTLVDRGAPMPFLDPVLMVETSVPRDTGASGVLRILAECVWTGEAATVDEAWEILHARGEAAPDRFVDALPTRGQAIILVDGHPFTFDLISGQLAWVAQARVGAVRVTVEGSRFDVSDVQLAEVHDLEPYFEGSRHFPMHAVRGL
jgi:hypothetical protein